MVHDGLTGDFEARFDAALDAALDELAHHRSVVELVPAILGHLRDAFATDDACIALDAGPGLREVCGTGRFAAIPPDPGAAGCLRSPVVLGGAEVGVVAVVPADPVGHDAEARLRRFALVVAAASSTAALVDTERAARSQQQALVRAGQALSASLVLRDVLRTILTELREVVPYDTASVQERRGDEMVIVGGQGIDMDVFEGVGFDVSGGGVPNADVLRRQEPLIIDDILGDHPYWDFPHDAHETSGVRSWMGVPMLFGNECIGMLTLDAYEKGFFTPAHAEAAMVYAAQAAIALQNARAFDQARSELDERRRVEADLRSANHSLRLRMSEIEALQEILREQAVRDALTGLHNRRYLMEALEGSVARAAELGTPLSVVMLDVDHFKEVNDRLGHNAGDRVLEAVGRFLAAQVRAGDAACRYGGEEFVAVLSGADGAVAERRAEGWRRSIESLSSAEGAGIPPITVSVGVATASEGVTADELVRSADVAMYRAKAAGRNTVVVAD